MRILIAETDYPQFLDALYSENPDLRSASHADQARVRALQFFSNAESYATHLTRLGHETRVVYTNNTFAQRAWALEKGDRRLRAELRIETAPGPASLRAPMTLARGLSRRVRQSSWLDRVLVAQVHAFSPDILICLNVVWIPPPLIRSLRHDVRILVGQHADSRLPDVPALNCYDLMVSSVPTTVDVLREAGINARPLRLGFDPDVLQLMPDTPPNEDLCFVGSFFSGVHDTRTALLEVLAERFAELKVWSSTLDGLPAESAIRQRYAGPAWGIEMFRVLRSSRIVLNHHTDNCGYANNLRLYEATGCGALLITDAKPNLSDLFGVGTEVLAYEDADHCIELVETYLRKGRERAAIATAGQERTLRDHSYLLRMEELLELINGLV